ncbi:MAG: 4Fe-4S binding protein [Anaerolineales bacterium]|nr:4Fe-4S binding protein [Anaerolineales bacterium]
MILPMIRIDLERCTGCGLCVEACSQHALVLEGKQVRVLDDRCQGCGACADACHREAIRLVDVPVAVPARDDRSSAAVGRHRRLRQRRGRAIASTSIGRRVS